jgi:hypothetical protein
MQQFWTELCTLIWENSDHPVQTPLIPAGWKRKNRSTPSAAVLFLVRDLSTKDIMNSDIRGVLIALIIVIVHFCHRHGRSFFAVSHCTTSNELLA